MPGITVDVVDLYVGILIDSPSPYPLPTARSSLGEGQCIALSLPSSLAFTASTYLRSVGRGSARRGGLQYCRSADGCSADSSRRWLDIHPRYPASTAPSSYTAR